jgi:hypothetical protein
MFELSALPARQGDAIWIRWGAAANPHQMIIDMGTGGSGKKVRERILELAENKRVFDLIVVTHVDEDHIGGLLTCLAEADPIPGFKCKDLWFNGFEHLSGKSITTGPNLEPLGPAQGEKLSNWLRTQAWNKAFAGAPVRRVPGEAIQTVELHDNLKLSVLGPTPERLEGFIDTWEEEVRIAVEKGRLDEAIVSPGLELLGSDNPPVLANTGDLEDLATKSDSVDTSKANGSSIALLLEYKGSKLILAGDAFSDDLVDGIEAVSPGERLHLDLFKLPHHGSKKNVHIDLIESVDCDRWLISTDGTRFKHPDAEAVARILAFTTADEPLLCFNVPSKFNGWWKKQEWIDMFEYDVEYGSAEDGLTITL